MRQDEISTTRGGSKALNFMSDIQPIDDEFLAFFKSETETTWQHKQLNPAIFGYQIQNGTRWNSGLTEAQVSNYESDLEVQFPHDFKRLLRYMNGTDSPSMNIYGSSGYPHRTRHDVYSYPRDLAAVREMIAWVEDDRKKLALVLSDQEYELQPDARLVPIYAHRYVVCGADPNESTVLSISGTDAIVYGNSLRAFLQIEFLQT